MTTRRLKTIGDDASDEDQNDHGHQTAADTKPTSLAVRVLEPQRQWRPAPYRYQSARPSDQKEQAKVSFLEAPTHSFISLVKRIAVAYLQAALRLGALSDDVVAAYLGVAMKTGISRRSSAGNRRKEGTPRRPAATRSLARRHYLTHDDVERLGSILMATSSGFSTKL